MRRLDTRAQRATARPAAVLPRPDAPHSHVAALPWYICRCVVLSSVQSALRSLAHATGIEGWLNYLGLPELVFTFLEFEIDDFWVVPFIRAIDLDDMGIKDLQQRRKLLTSIQRLQNLQERESTPFSPNSLAHHT